jgi:hypothetical protein
MSMLVDWTELELTFEFVSSGPVGAQEAVLCRKTGKFLWHTEQFDDVDDWPEDADDEEKYLSIPHKNELDLGKPLVFEFARQFLPDEYDEVRSIFSRRGAYGQFKGSAAAEKGARAMVRFREPGDRKGLARMV